MSHREKVIIAIAGGCLILYLAVQLVFPYKPKTKATKPQTQPSYPSAMVKISPSVSITPIDLPSQTCSLVTTVGGKTIVSTKDKNIRAHFEQSKIPAVTDILLVNEKFYVWDEAKKKGHVGDLSGKSNLLALYLNNFQHMEAKDCQQTDLPDSIFAVPSDITFDTFTNVEY